MASTPETELLSLRRAIRRCCSEALKLFVDKPREALFYHAVRIPFLVLEAMIRSVQRALAVIECFDRKVPALSLHDLSARVGLAKSTTFRLASTLVDAGYLTQRENQDYTLSFKLLPLANVVQSTLDIREIAHPVMTELAAKSGETLDLSVLSGLERVSIDVVESSLSLKHVIAIGERHPLLHGATGKLFLTYMDAADVERVIAESRPAQCIDPDRLARQLHRIRRLGYAITSNERILGMTSIAVPIRDHSGDVAYCLALSGPSIRFSGRKAEFCAMMLQAAADLSRRSGYRPAPKEKPSKAPHRDGR